MNSKEVEIAKELSNIIPSKGIWVLNVKGNYQIRAILMFLKALVDFKKMSGIVITMEKPHHYLTYLLGIHGISQRSITYVDLALSHKKIFKFPIVIESQEPVVGGFFHRETVNLKDYGFMLIDNIGHTRMHLRKETHQKIANYLIEEAKKHRIFALFPMDKERCPDVYTLLKNKADRIMLWEEVIKIAD